MLVEAVLEGDDAGFNQSTGKKHHACNDFEELGHLIQTMDKQGYYLM